MVSNEILQVNGYHHTRLLRDVTYKLRKMKMENWKGGGGEHWNWRAKRGVMGAQERGGKGRSGRDWLGMRRKGK